MAKYMILISLCIYLLTSQDMLLAQTSSTTVFTFRAPESANDSRYNYDNALFKLALDKTVKEFGEYELKPSPVMNYLRARLMAEANQFPNFFFKHSFTSKLSKKLDYVPIPLDRGIVGYRVFLLSSNNLSKLDNINTIDQLKKFHFVQGAGWTDIEILSAAGFKVDALSDYNSLFHFVARGRADVFPRGANELLSEYNSFKHIENLTYDTKLVLHYLLPRFFYSHRNNQDAIKRVTTGLQKAWEDGSFQKLWEEQYRESIDFLKLHDRTVFSIDNPLTEQLEDGYQQYIYDPFSP